jgi:hypothetical protein
MARAIRVVGYGTGDQSCRLWHGQSELSAVARAIRVVGYGTGDQLLAVARAIRVVGYGTGNQLLAVAQVFRVVGYGTGDQSCRLWHGRSELSAMPWGIRVGKSDG